MPESELKSANFRIVSLGVCNDFFTDMTVIDMDSGDLTGELYQYNSPIFTGPSSLVGRIITEDTHPQHTGIIGTPPLFENFDFDMFLEFQLIKNLPWFQLQNIMENLGQHSSLVLRSAKLLIRTCRMHFRESSHGRGFPSIFVAIQSLRSIQFKSNKPRFGGEA